jgi:hypothetical protein
MFIHFDGDKGTQLTVLLRNLMTWFWCVLRTCLRVHEVKILETFACVVLQDSPVYPVIALVQRPSPLAITHSERECTRT